MKKLSFVLSLTLLCLLTDCSKKDAVAPEKAEKVISDDGSSSASSLRVIPNYRIAFVEIEFGVKPLCLGLGMCNITIVNEKTGVVPPDLNGKRRALAKVVNGNFTLVFMGNHIHQQLNGPAFIMGADLILPLAVTDRVGLQPGHTINQGSYLITSGPGNKKTVVF